MVTVARMIAPILGNLTIVDMDCGPAGWRLRPGMT
jgi:hypothetical protein